jgi:hypothetical protein
MKLRTKYILHLMLAHKLNACIFAIVALALSRYGWVDALCLSLVFLINFYDHIKSHHRYEDFVGGQNRVKK